MQRQLVLRGRWQVEYILCKLSLSRGDEQDFCKETMTFALVGELECVWEAQALCGEGPLWIESEQSLYFLDIDGQKLHRLGEASTERRTWELPEKTGWILPRNNRADFVVGCKSGMYFLDLETKQHTFALLPDPEYPENRFNDAKCDRDGRIWAGRSHDPETEQTGHLFRIDPDLSHSRWDGPYVCPNGPALSPDDRTLYHVDTFTRSIWAFDKQADGMLSNRRLFVKLTEAKEGFPDGLTVDCAGRVWLAHWGGSRITCFNPQGERLGVIPLPVPQVTSCAFGGSDLSTLYITTAARRLDFAEHPLAGALFRIPTQASGFASPAFAG